MSTRYGKWDVKLVCRVKTLHYDFRTQRGEIYFPEGHCCDVLGCRKLFEAIDPDVQLIQTYSGKELDTMYKRVDGEWRAICR